MRWTLALVLMLLGCPSDGLHGHDGPTGGDDDDGGTGGNTFPDFVTENDDYFVTRIGAVPSIDRDGYRLSIGGLVDEPTSYTLSDLEGLATREITLTIECIGNGAEGSLVSTAIWGGFDLYELLEASGIQSSATGVRYTAQDGYYASHTLDQLRDNGVMGALTMNGEPIPQVHGYPLRILNPGFHGVKQPAWVTGIEVIDQPVQDYWEDRGWDCSPPMEVDSKFFFPIGGTEVAEGEDVLIGGAAFGGARIERVELSIDEGATWKEAEIVSRLDLDHVWVFWQVSMVFDFNGQRRVIARATDLHGAIQPASDPDTLDGNNNRPVLTLQVE